MGDRVLSTAHVLSTYACVIRRVSGAGRKRERESGGGGQRGVERMTRWHEGGSTDDGQRRSVRSSVLTGVKESGSRECEAEGDK